MDPRLRPSRIPPRSVYSTLRRGNLIRIQGCHVVTEDGSDEDDVQTRVTRRKPRVLESRIERVKTAQRARGSVWHAKKHTIHTGKLAVARDILAGVDRHV